MNIKRGGFIEFLSRELPPPFLLRISQMRYFKTCSVLQEYSVRFFNYTMYIWNKLNFVDVVKFALLLICKCNT